MDALILAAGIGSRLQELGEKTPKCLLEVHQKTLLERQISVLLKNGIQTIYIVGGYQFEKIKQFIDSTFLNQPIVLIENKEYATTNNMASLLLAKPFLEGRSFLWLNGDIIFEPEVIQGILSESFLDAIAIDSTCYFEESMKVTIAENRIQSIAKNININQASGTSIDLYKISSKTSFALFNQVDLLLQKDKMQWSEVALNQILKSHIFLPFYIHSKWVEIDDQEDLFVAQQLFD